MRPIASAPALPLSEWILLCSWSPMIGNCAERRVQHVGLCLGSAFEHEAEHRDQHQQQREQRGEAVVGDQRGQLPGLIVAELLDHRRAEAQRRVTLLEAVDRVQALADAHTNWEGGLWLTVHDISACPPDQRMEDNLWVPICRWTRSSNSRWWRVPSARFCCGFTATGYVGRTSRIAIARRPSSC